MGLGLLPWPPPRGHLRVFVASSACRCGERLPEGGEAWTLHAFLLGLSMAKPDPWAKRWPESDLPSAERAFLPTLQQQLLAWQPRHGRHDLPWHTSDHYGVWVSEVMLQQTQVATGLYRYPACWSLTPPILFPVPYGQQDLIE